MQRGAVDGRIRNRHRPEPTASASANSPRASLASCTSERMVPMTTDASNGLRSTASQPAARASSSSSVFERSRGEDHPHVAVEFLDVAAEIQTAAAGKKRVRDHQIRIGIGQARERGSLIRHARDFEALLAQNTLAHPLGVRAVVRQQDGAHSSSGILPRAWVWRAAAAGARPDYSRAPRDPRPAPP